jgi:hypothetical protein
MNLLKDLVVAGFMLIAIVGVVFLVLPVFHLLGKWYDAEKRRARNQRRPRWFPENCEAEPVRVVVHRRIPNYDTEPSLN